MVHAATHLENNMGSRVEVTSGSKNKGKKTCFRWSTFMIDYIPVCKITNGFKGASSV